MTGYDSTTSKLITATAFTGSFGYWNGSFTKGSGDSAKDNDTMTYTAITDVTQETKTGGTTTDAYTATGLVSSTDTTTKYGIYYHFELDYMITATKSLKVTATATPSVETTPNIAQATRVGIIEAKSVTMTDKQMTNADFTDQTGKEYTVAAPAKTGTSGTDYNLEELKALGYKGESEYKTGLTRLDEAGATITNTTALATTSDKAFEYGSLSIYVWFDGTDYSFKKI